MERFSGASRPARWRWFRTPDPGVRADPAPARAGPSGAFKSRRQGRVPGSNFGGIQWFTNNGNFSDTVIGTFGSCPAQLGWLHGPGYSDLDLSLQKNFQITERYKLQFRSDFINAFNQVNLNVPDMGLGATMGQITSSQASRNIQFALKFYY